MCIRDSRDRVQILLRQTIMDAALARASEISWSQVRMSDLADDVGVSRQTIHSEFGTKDSLVAALFEREVERVLSGLHERFTQAATFEVGLREALLWMLEEVAEERVIGRMVADARAGSTDGLVPVLTYQSNLLVEPVRRRIVAAGMERWSTIDPLSLQWWWSSRCASSWFNWLRRRTCHRSSWSRVSWSWRGDLRLPEHVD